ncbi:MAG: hypothetical protein M0Z94_05625 [Dehalococcoidales bacterium]|nr:hypothetical protein [Dehalococcoidales bacterium]
MKRLFTVFALILALSALALPAAAGGAAMVPDAIYADGTLFGTVLTPTNLPDHGKFDALYNFDNSGLMGQPSISEAKPGDQDYNGGRWLVYPVTFTATGLAHFDPDGDGVVNTPITSDADLMMYESQGYVTIGSMAVASFVCPLIPQR